MSLIINTNTIATQTRNYLAATRPTCSAVLIVAIVLDHETI